MWKILQRCGCIVACLAKNEILLHTYSLTIPACKGMKDIYIYIGIYICVLCARRNEASMIVQQTYMWFILWCHGYVGILTIHNTRIRLVVASFRSLDGDRQHMQQHVCIRCMSVRTYMPPRDIRHVGKIDIISCYYRACNIVLIGCRGALQYCTHVYPWAPNQETLTV